MPVINLQFSLHGPGATIPADHGYPLYSAISRLLPALHDADADFAICPICGLQTGDRRMAITPNSRLTFRLEAARIADVLPLAGRSLGFGSTFLQIGVPTVDVLIPAPTLRARLVVIKGYMEAEPFAEAVRAQLRRLEISDAVKIELGKRRTMLIRSANVVGYEVVLRNLTPEESICVQGVGLGGRRKMGCGIFCPRRETASTERAN